MRFRARELGREGFVIWNILARSDGLDECFGWEPVAFARERDILLRYWQLMLREVSA